VWAVAGFPNHLVFYRVRRGTVLIRHVLSGARDLDRWVG
jgi:plasmid stabilization system protein ParE